MSNTVRTLKDYNYTIEIPTRILDNGGGHLNHAVFFVLYEQALNTFLAEHGPGPRFVRLVRHAANDYLNVVHGFPRPVTVAIGVRKLGKTSLDLEFAMFQDGEEASAVGHVVSVFVDMETLRPTDKAFEGDFLKKLREMYLPKNIMAML